MEGGERGFLKEEEEGGKKGEKTNAFSFKGGKNLFLTKKRG